MQAMDTFWRRLATAALVLWLVLTVASPAGAATEDVLQRFEFVEPQMGVPFRIVLYAPDAPAAKAASRAAFDRVAELNQIMSDYETDSELNELSRTSGQGRAVPVSEDLWKVLERAQAVAEATTGAFDITVGPAVVLWRNARRTQAFPDVDRLAQARERIGHAKVRLHPAGRQVELTTRQMKLDLGGIAKGYALDEALTVLRARGVKQALVSGGGDMVLGDPPPGTAGWRIEVAPLDVANAPPKRYVRLSNAALATSGDVFQRLEIDGKRYSHIVDPRTGIGLTDHSLVTVIALDGLTADSLATAVSVLGPEKGLAYAATVPGVEAHVVRKPDDQIVVKETPGFARFREPTPPSAE